MPLACMARLPCDEASVGALAVRVKDACVRCARVGDAGEHAPHADALGNSPVAVWGLAPLISGPNGAVSQRHAPTALAPGHRRPAPHPRGCDRGCDTGAW
jgi:hypothetical protein